MAETFLVMGAAGFIGRHVCRALAAGGHRVHGIGHGPWSTEEWRDWGLSRWTDADLGERELAHALMGSSPRAIIHCAGSGSVAHSYAHPLDDFERNVGTTAATLEVVRRQANTRTRVVLTSSAAVYGDQGEVDLTEMSPRSPVSPYGFNKLAAENLCDSYARFFGIGVSVVRLFSVYGEGLRKQLLWDAMNKFARGQDEFFGTGNELRDWIHVEDAAALLCAAALAPHAHFDVFNGGHVKATTREVLNVLARESGSPQRPRFSGETHTGNPRRLTSECGHAQRLLGWQALIGLDDGLARYARWFRDQATMPVPGFA